MGRAARRRRGGPHRGAATGRRDRAHHRRRRGAAAGDGQRRSRRPAGRAGVARGASHRGRWRRRRGHPRPRPSTRGGQRTAAGGGRRERPGRHLLHLRHDGPRQGCHADAREPDVRDAGGSSPDGVDGPAAPAPRAHGDAARQHVGPPGAALLDRAGHHGDRPRPLRRAHDARHRRGPSREHPVGHAHDVPASLGSRGRRPRPLLRRVLRRRRRLLPPGSDRPLPGAATGRRQPRLLRHRLRHDRDRRAGDPGVPRAGDGRRPRRRPARDRLPHRHE